MASLTGSRLCSVTSSESPPLPPEAARVPGSPSPQNTSFRGMLLCPCSVIPRLLFLVTALSCWGPKLLPQISSVPAGDVPLCEDPISLTGLGLLGNSEPRPTACQVETPAPKSLLLISSSTPGGAFQPLPQWVQLGGWQVCLVPLPSSPGCFHPALPRNLLVSVAPTFLLRKLSSFQALLPCQACLLLKLGMG